MKYVSHICIQKDREQRRLKGGRRHGRVPVFPHPEALHKRPVGEAGTGTGKGGVSVPSFNDPTYG